MHKRGARLASIAAAFLILAFLPCTALAAMTAAYYYDLAFSEYKAGNLAAALADAKEGAIADYDQSLKLKPDYGWAYLDRSKARQAIGDTKGAVNLGMKAIRAIAETAPNSSTPERSLPRETSNPTQLPSHLLSLEVIKQLPLNRSRSKTAVHPHVRKLPRSADSRH